MFLPSFCGRAFFTTTLNPNSERLARRSPFPTWVWNQKRQFDALKEGKVYDRWQQSIRKWDADFDPSSKPNPALSDFGKVSAASELPGFKIEPCPFQPNNTEQERMSAGVQLVKRAKQHPLLAGEIKAALEQLQAIPEPPTSR